MEGTERLPADASERARGACLRNFHDKTLQEMLQYRPQTSSEMLDISGVGQTKLDRYGEQFLEIIRQP